MRFRRVLFLCLALAAVLAAGFSLYAAWYHRPMDAALVKAAREGDYSTVKLLLREGANPNVRDERHLPLVEWALLEGRTDLAEMLMDKGARADVNFCLLHAASERNEGTMEFLLNRGAGVNTRDEEARTPLMLAAMKNRDGWGSGPTDIRKLLRAGAEVNARSRAGRTALMEAARARDEGTVKVLLAAEAEVNAQDETQSTALMLAAESGRGPIVRMLLNHGADPDLKDRRGQTAASIAGEGNGVEAQLALRQAVARK
jgi:ankyrin repeat protein